ncbi:MAG: hypothetical protein Q4D79_14965 [Propionibacteriaceae bacterium]|nr:hypothetical protein [Propionibacteriaceae bacterium]
MRIKVESRRFYHHADRLGLLVVQDAVSGGQPRVGLRSSGVIQALDLPGEDRSRYASAVAGRADPANRKEFWAELAAMIRTLHPHPSVVAWVPFNEAWGSSTPGGWRTRRAASTRPGSSTSPLAGTSRAAATSAPVTATSWPCARPRRGTDARSTCPSLAG